MKNEKLVEATMLALRGKLLEEVDRDFEKVLDYINGDYHRVEDFTDLEVCYPNEEDTDWLDAYDVANELLNKLSKEDWATMAKEIDDGTLRDKLTDWGMKAGSLEEARSHKEDNERVAPRTTTRNGKEVKITDMQKDLDNTFVGKRYAKGAVANNPYYGGQYYGTTDAEYRSKRNKTGQKRTSNIDMSKKYDIYKADTFETPVTDYQFAMDRYKSYEKTGNEDIPIAQSYKKSAQDIVNKERERIANKSTENKKITEDIDEDKTKIIFRKDKEDGDIIAVFAEDIQSNNRVGCYAHMGQHSTMSLDYYNKGTTPATPEEYADLKRELEGIGYNVEVVDKLNENKKVTEAIDEKSLEISIDLKNKTYQEWFDEMKNKYGLVYQYTSVLGPKDAPVGKIYVFKDNEDYNYAITNGKEFNRLYDDGKLTVTGKKDTVKKAEARSHKEDNEKVAPRRQHSPYQREYGRVYGDLKDVPKRARFSANKGNASDWGYYDLNELDTYNKSTDDIEDYKRYKTDAESERALARYHNANAQQNDDRASDIVRDKKLDRAKRNLKGQEIFDVEESKKVESEEDAINVMNNFRDKDASYGYVVSYLENNAPNNEEILKLCKEILAKGAINVCGKDKINDFYNKCKSDIEARINALGENYIKTILAQYVFEDVIYGLEDNLESAIQK